MRNPPSQLARCLLLLIALGLLALSTQSVSVWDHDAKLSKHPSLTDPDQPALPLADHTADAFAAEAKDNTEKKLRIAVTVVEGPWKLAVPRFVVIQSRPIVRTWKLDQRTQPVLSCGPPALV